MSQRRTLVLVTKRSQNHRPDFLRIRRYLKEIASDVEPVVMADRHHNMLRPGLWLRPTLFFSPCRMRKFRPVRGRLFHCIQLRKSEEYLALERHGIPVPRWTLLTETHRPKLGDFGEYVVSKPDRGSLGAEVKIRRRSRVRWKRPENPLARNCSDQVVQEFIYTGPWPSSYRVATLFGKCLWSWKVEADHGRRPLAGPAKFAEGATGGGMSIVSSGSGCKFSLNYEPDVIALAERAHAAFPDHPLLGADVIREQPSGNLYVIEVNSGGHQWHVSSPRGLAIQESCGINLASQFDAIRKAAHILLDYTRRHAC